MLDRLRGCDQGGIENVLVVDLAGDIVGFLDDAVDGRTIGALRALAEHLEGLFQTLHLVLGLAQMRLEGRAEIAAGRLLDHVGQGFQDLLFRVVDVLQDVQEQVVHGLDVFGKEAHSPYSVFFVLLVSVERLARPGVPGVPRRSRPAA